MKLTFSSFSKDTELNEQRELFRSAFPENHGLPPETEEFYHRKFSNFPYAPASYEYIARDEEGMVGYYAAIPYSYRVGEQDLLCGMVCDVMTAPRVQGKGVFTKLGAFSLSSLQDTGVDFVTGYPRRAAVIPGHLKVGWQIAFKLPLYALPLKCNAILASRRLALAASAGNLAIRMAHGILKMLRPSGRGITVREFDWKAFLAEEDYAPFLEQWRAQHRNSLNKSEEFLRWRLGYQQADYRVVAAYFQDRLIGVSILRSICPEGVPSLALLDFMAIEQEDLVLSTLAEGWKALAARLGGELILTMMSEHLARRRRIWRLGFLATPTVFSLIIKPLSERAKLLVSTEADHWDLMWIDCDDL